jgi:hypothetical protein
MLPPGSVLAVLKSYYDRSGTENNRLMTLAGVAASVDVWAGIEERWIEILGNHVPSADYFHSVEASGLRGQFSKNRWDDAKVDGLVSQLLVYLTTLNKDAYFQFSVTIQMDDYRSLQAKSYQMRSPAELCTEYCTDAIMNWYVSKYKGLDVEAAFFFDRNEPFEEIFRAEWREELSKAQASGSHTLWTHIRSVSSACKENEPGIQIADMFAWGVNRILSGNRRFAHMAIAMNTFLNSKSVTLGEDYLRRRFRPLIWQ